MPELYIFTLNVSFFSVFFGFLKCNTFFYFFRFYFYWSHRAMINSQCTCH